MTDDTRLPPPARKPGSALAETSGGPVAHPAVAAPSVTALPGHGVEQGRLSGPAPSATASLGTNAAPPIGGGHNNTTEAHDLPKVVRPPSKYGIIKGAVRTALYTVPALAALLLSDPAKERVVTDPLVDQKTGLTKDYAAQLKEQYGKRTPEQMRADLDAAVARSAAAKAKAGTPVVTAPDATQQAMAAGNQGFALANKPTGQTPASRAFLNGLMTSAILGAVSLVMRRRSGGSWTGAFSNQAQGLTGALYGLDDSERAHRGQMNATHNPKGPLNGRLKADWNHKAAIADGQSVPPRPFPEVQSTFSGSRVELVPAAEVTDLQKKLAEGSGVAPLQAKPDTTKLAKNPGLYPPPGSTP